MKRIALTIAVLLSINISTIWAEGALVGESSPESNAANTSSVRYVKAPRFARPLLERWITEYAKAQPGIEFQIAKGNQNQGNADLNIVFDNQTANTKVFSHNVVYFGEFAVLPITASGSEAAKVLEGKHLNSKKLKQLYFLNDDFDEDVKKIKQFENLVIYSGSNATSVAASFAHNFGGEQQFPRQAHLWRRPLPEYRPVEGPAGSIIQCPAQYLRSAEPSYQERTHDYWYRCEEESLRKFLRQGHPR